MIMKKYLAIGLVLVFAAGCKKDQPIQKVTGLVGKWELRIEMGGFGPNKTYPAGTGNTIQFNADSTFVQYQNFGIVRQGSYSLRIATDPTGRYSFDELYYNNKIWNSVQLKPDTLIIGTSAFDGIADMYLRDK
jgi:hypothetical protein